MLNLLVHRVTRRLKFLFTRILLILGFTDTKDIGNYNEICKANCGQSRRLEEKRILPLLDIEILLSRTDGGIVTMQALVI
jgi:hypothetical protein